MTNLRTLIIILQKRIVRLIAKSMFDAHRAPILYKMTNFSLKSSK